MWILTLMCHLYVFTYSFIYFYLFIYLFGLRSGNQHLSHSISFLTGQPALFCSPTWFPICVPLFPSLQLSKLKRLLALQRESCRPSCPLIKQIVSTHTHSHTRPCVHAHTDVALCFSLYPGPLSEKVKYVLRQPHICRGIRELQPSRRELSCPIRQLTLLRKGQCNFILHTYPYTHTHTLTHTHFGGAALAVTLHLIRFITMLTNLNLILNFSLNLYVSVKLEPHLPEKKGLKSSNAKRSLSIIKLMTK